MSDMLSALILGIVEGLTEFLPVSSTGHMIIVGHMIGFDGNLAKIFDVVIQLGAILSVLVLYRGRFARFFTKEGWQLGKGLSAYHVLAGCILPWRSLSSSIPLSKNISFLPLRLPLALF